MSLSPNGRDCVLAGRRGLFIIDLDDPFTPPRWLHHITSWEVADVQWSPHHHIKPSWCISTSNQKALLWDLHRPSNNAIVEILHAHTRAISDINFHPFDAEILATCSIDTFVYSWDMRAPRKPVAQWSEWRAGASQVKWNHENPYEIASSHDHSFYIWDTRKGALPVVKVDKAHRGKINGLDFNQGLKNMITCSNDNTVKFWDLQNGQARKYIDEYNYFANRQQIEEPQSELHPSVVVKLDFPISRARQLPFGKDMACGIMPLRGGDDSIHIVNYDTAYQEYVTTGETQEIGGDSVYAFKGHNGPMKDFLWRTQHETYQGYESNKWKDYQLVTWSSTDYDLKLWPKSEELYKSVNYDPSFVNVFKGTGSDSDISRPHTPEQTHPYNYETYCVEPSVTIDDFFTKTTHDLLSSLTLLCISEKHKSAGVEFTQLNHLDWISGVRMGRPAQAEDGQMRRKDSGGTFEDEGPLNLGEEVSIVGHKFPKIRFEKIAVSSGELVISLRGPIPDVISTSMTKAETSDNVENNTSVVGDSTVISNKDRKSEDGHDQTSQASVKDIISPLTPLDDSVDQKLVFIRLKVNFPKTYPYLEQITKKRGKYLKQNAIRFNIEITHELTKEIRDVMLDKLVEISQFYTNKYQRFCLEPCLRSLMGEKVELIDDITETRNEQDQEQEEHESVQEVGNEGWVDDLINQQPDFRGYSSGEEEDYTDLIPAPGATTTALTDSLVLSPSLQPKDSVPIAQAHARAMYYDSTPQPKGCGAVWSRTGKLVCFFIPKTYQEDENRTKFNIFKFTNRGLSVKMHEHKEDTDSEMEDEEDSDGAESLNSESSHSSDDSFTNDWDEVLQDEISSRNRIPRMFTLGFGGYGDSSKKSSSINKLPSQGGGTKSSIKSRKQLQKHQQKQSKNRNIVGIFDFSHLLPDKYELACEYRVLGDIPENLALYNSQIALKYGLEEISQVWKILSVLLVKNGTSQQQAHSFYWGNHPFGSNWLIKEIFDYFEQRQNVQMLAMMSCILYENPKNLTIPEEAHDEIGYNIPIHTPYQALPQPPSIATLSRVNRQHSNSIPQSILQPTMLLYPLLNHANSSVSSLKRDSSIVTGSINSSLDGLNSNVGSPERFGYMKKNLTMTGIPGVSEHSYSSLGDSLTDFRTDSPSKLKFEKRMIRSSRAGTTSGLIRPKGVKVKPPPSVTIEMQNVEELDLYENVHCQSLLNGQDDLKIRNYRQLYGDMLYNWGLPVSRIKILKFNYPEVEQEVKFDLHKCKIGLRKRSKQLPGQNFLNAISTIVASKPNAWNTNKRSILKYCNLCNLIVTKNFTLCIICEHVLHTDCAMEWWAGDNTECPSGCGCTCLDR
ncbi:Maintenance of telomere capping protein 5 [Spathaspora sp. JA1]|nr:Maintenance of telomere capping protein 5 [Spathaspora sp. JA1]